MALSIQQFNIDPNRVWFVRLADTGTGISVELYLTEEDAEEQTNLQASGATTGYGSGLEVWLTAEESASVQISMHQSSLDWHITVSGAAADPTRILQIKEFVDLDDISHAIFANSNLVPLRAKAEIDAHTHAVITRSVQLGTHLPEIVVGEICAIESVSRDVSELGQVIRHQISGTPSSLLSTLDVASYKELKR